MNTYPWQEEQWQHLQLRLKENRLPHALLFSGPQGLGKTHFASVFAKSLLCNAVAADGRPCGTCNSCLWLASGSHPDALWITLEEGAKAINVNQIRDTARFLSLKSQQGRYKVIVISPADQMNVNAFNSLLKTLEEPTENAIIILVCHQIASLPATIRSRCQKLEFVYPKREVSLAWLRSQIDQVETADTLLCVAKGAPLHALEMAKSDAMSQRSAFFEDVFNLAKGLDHPISVSEKWVKQDIKQNLSWFHDALADMIKLTMSDKSAFIAHADYTEAMQNQTRGLNLNALYRCYERVSDAQRQLKANMNPQLLAESILIPWTEMNKGNTVR